MEYLATDSDEGSDKTSFLTGLLAKGRFAVVRRNGQAGSIETRESSI